MGPLTAVYHGSALSGASLLRVSLHMITQVEGTNVYGVAIPTVAGLRHVMNEMGAQNGEEQ